jgi:hypothetical protein
MTSLFSTTRSYSRWLMTMVALVILVACLPACKEKKKGGDPAIAEPAVDVTCFTLTKKQIQDEWITPGYTSNSDPKKNINYIQFFTSVVPRTNNFDINIQAYDTTGAPLGNLIKLGTGQGCPINLPTVLIGRNFLDFKRLNILKDPTTIADYFQRIVFTPAIFQKDGFDLLQFKTTAFYENTTMGLEGALPCPPCINCRPPCPDYCTPACTPEQLDSLASINPMSPVRPIDTANIRKQ